MVDFKLLTNLKKYTVHIKAADSDKHLLKEYKNSGDLEILGILYNRYIHLVYGVCLKYLEDREQSKDAVSHIFENLIIEIPKFEIDNFKSWLYVVTKNHCLMQIRKNKASKKKMDEFVEEKFMESTTILHPIDETEDTDLEGVLKRCIEKLKDQQKDSINLFYFEKKCYREIADTMQVSEKKIKSLIQNGKRNLKICIEETKSDVA